MSADSRLDVLHEMNLPVFCVTVGKFIDSATIPDDIMQPHVHTHKLAEYSICWRPARRRRRTVIPVYQD